MFPLIMVEHIGGGRPGEELSNVALVTYRGLRDKGQGRSRTNILKSSSDYPEVCSCVAIFTQGAVCTGRLFTVPWCRYSGSGRRIILSGGYFILCFFLFLIEDRTYTAAERFSSEWLKAGMGTQKSSICYPILGR